MYILDNNNKSVTLRTIPDQLTSDINFCVIDTKNDLDYYFLPLYWMERYVYGAARLEINNQFIDVPLDWSILIEAVDHLETVRVENIIDKDFRAFCFNPLSSYSPSFPVIKVSDIFMDVEWFVPKLGYGNLLAVPLNGDDKPPCVYFVKDDNKIPDELDISELI